MNQLFTPQNIFDVFITLGGVAFVVAQIQLGRGNKKSGDEADALVTIKLKDAAIAQLTSEVARLQNEVTQAGKDIAVLRADNIRLSLIVENKNPELETYMRDSMEYLKVISKGIEGILSKPTVAIHNEPRKND